MTTFERRQGQLMSYMGVAQGSAAPSNAQATADVESACQEGLRHKIAKWRVPTSFHSSSTITSKPNPNPNPTREASPSTTSTITASQNASILSDTGTFSTTPSSQASQSEPTGLALPGTDLKCYDIPIPDGLKDRFFDIKFLYTQPLLDSISKRKKDPGDISMKLKQLGLNSQNIELHIVIQCEKKIAKRVRRFFAQHHVKEDLSSDFRVLVLEKALLRLTNQEPIEVVVGSIPETTLCGMPIRLSQGSVSVAATFGGIIGVETSYKRLFGLTAAHSLKKLQVSNRNEPTISRRKSSLPSSASEASDSDCDSSVTSDSSGISPTHSNIEVWSDDGSQETLALGTIFCDTFNTRTEENYDWALIDLSPGDGLPNKVERSDNSEKSVDNQISLPSSASITGSPARRALVLKQGSPQMGLLSLHTSFVSMSPGSTFVKVHDLTMDSECSLSPGDSGSWVVNEMTSELYGHVVSVDAFGEAQVMPIHPTLDSIREKLNASRVFLPTSDQIQHLQSTLNGQSRADPEALTSLWEELPIVLFQFGGVPFEDIPSQHIPPEHIPEELDTFPPSHSTDSGISYQSRSTDSGISYQSFTTVSGNNSPKIGLSTPSCEEDTSALARRLFGQSQDCVKLRNPDIQDDSTTTTASMVMVSTEGPESMDSLDSRYNEFVRESEVVRKAHRSLPPDGQGSSHVGPGLPLPYGHQPYPLVTYPASFSFYGLPDNPLLPPSPLSEPHLYGSYAYPTWHGEEAPLDMPSYPCYSGESSLDSAQSSAESSAQSNAQSNAQSSENRPLVLKKKSRRRRTDIKVEQPKPNLTRSS